MRPFRALDTRPFGSLLGRGEPAAFVISGLCQEQKHKNSIYTRLILILLLSYIFCNSKCKSFLTEANFHEKLDYFQSHEKP